MARIRLPNAVLYVTSLFRPHLLRPDIRVPSITHVDFQGLRAAGFNAVVVDKDNCMTLPNRDELHPPLSGAWANLLSAFPKGRVLVVSNSAGTKKDPSGIAAESVSHHLKCPVLLHGRPKPGCAQEILAYFSGTLGAPRTLRKEVLSQTAAESKEEEEDEAFFLQKWQDRVRGPLLGPLLDQAGQPVKPEQDPARAEKPVPKNPAQAMDEFPDKKGKKEEGPASGVNAAPTADEAIRVVVIGDRLFTDTLLANQLRAQLANTPAPQAFSAGPASQERVVSIHTTLLPQPSDVRALRWLEQRLTRGRLRQSAVDWGRFVVDPNASDGSISPVPAPAAPKGWARLVPPLIRDAPPLTRDPRSWKPVPVLLGLGRGLVFLARWSGRQAVRGVKWAWARAKRRSELAKESLENQSSAEKTLEKVAA